MRTQKNNQAPAKIWWQPFMIAMVIVLLLWVIGPQMRTVSPGQMVAAQIVHGEKIALAPKTGPVNASLTDSHPAINTPVVSVLPPAKSRANEAVASAKPGRYQPVSFKQLSDFRFVVTDELVNPLSDMSEANQEVCDQIPVPVLKLNGQDIKLTGFMLPVILHDELVTDFMLLPNQMTCCYGVKPRINEWIIVHAAGKGVKPMMDMPVTAQGAFRVGPLRENGSLTGIYELNLAQLTYNQ